MQPNFEQSTDSTPTVEIRLQTGKPTQDLPVIQFIQYSAETQYTHCERQRHRGRIPGNIWSAEDGISYIPQSLS